MGPIVTQQDVTQLGTILSVWAHPDDESFLAGGLLATAVQNGQRVICVTATHGEAGVQDELRWPAAQLGNIRTRELQAALKELGISEHIWLDYRDGECDKADQTEATKKIATLIEKYQPDTILTFGSEGLTGHPDHQAVSRWVGKAVETLKAKVYHAVYDFKQYQEFLIPLDKKINVFFNIDEPPLVAAKDCDIAFVLPDEVLGQKLRALAAMPSQMERTLVALPAAEDKKGTFGFEYFVRA